MISAFFLLILLAFSDEIEYAANVFTLPRTWAAAIYLGCDFLILMVLRWQRGRIRRAMDREKAWQVTVCWWLGFVLMLLADVYSLDPSLPIGTALHGLLLSVVYAAAMLVLFAATMDANPLMVVRKSLRDYDTKGWEGLRATLPLVAGIFAAYLASTWWDTTVGPLIDQRKNPPMVDVQFFAQASQVLPFLIVALGFEIGTFREAMAKETQRAAAVLSLTFLCAGEVLSLTMLVAKTTHFWHNYSAFIVVMIAGLIGLTTLVGALMEQSRGRPQQDEPPRKPPSPPGQVRAWHQVFAVGVITTAVLASILRRRNQR
jgi:hypothetical protein